MRWNIFSCILHGGEKRQISSVVVAVAMINAWPTDVNPNFCWKELKHLHTNQSYHCWPFLLSTAAKLRQPVGGKQQTLINPKGDHPPPKMRVGTLSLFFIISMLKSKSSSKRKTTSVKCKRDKLTTILNKLFQRTTNISCQGSFVYMRNKKEE